MVARIVLYKCFHTKSEFKITISALYDTNDKYETHHIVLSCTKRAEQIIIDQSLDSSLYDTIY